jgi:hypothetical protein
MIMVGGLAGLLIAGWPRSANDDVVVGAGVLATASSTVPALTAASSTASPTTTTPPRSVTRRATTTEAVITRTSPARPISRRPSTATPEMRPRKDVTVVVANGGFSDGLAGRGAGSLSALGYVAPKAQNAVKKNDRSVVYFVQGFQREAVRLAEDLGLRANQVLPKPTRSVSRADGGAELIVVLGGDFLR